MKYIPHLMIFFLASSIYGEFQDSNPTKGNSMESIQRENLMTNVMSESCVVEVGALYRHYKGNLYKVLAIARHSEDPNLLMVVYQALYNTPQFGKNSIWCRPYPMFTEMVDIHGQLQPRFAKTEETAEDTYHHGIKFILQNSEHKILILKNSKGTWDLPGGRVQRNESDLNAGKREVQEETGIVSLDNITYVTSFPGQIRISLNQQHDCGLIYSFYKASIGDQAIKLSDEHMDYKWISFEEIVKYLGELFGKNLQYLVKNLS